MKKRILIFTMIMALMVVSGCGNKGANQPEKAPENKQPEMADVNAAYLSQYEDVLAGAYRCINNIYNSPEPADGFEGIREAAYALGDEALNEIGYVLQDVSGDEVPELLIGVFDKAEGAYTNNEIYAVYALHGETPELVLQGMSRSAYSLKDDRSFFYQGSSGAAYSIFGRYHLSDAGELVCDDYYFTHPNDEDLMVIEIYHNNTGVFDKEESERLDITLDAFWDLADKVAEGTAKLEWTPFAELDARIVEKALAKPTVPDKALLSGEWSLVSGMVDGDEYTAAEAGYQTELSISGTSAYYLYSMNGIEKSMTAELVYLDEPVYEGCGNDEWSVEFVKQSSDFGEDEAFYATLIDDNTLLLQQFFPFDGTQGVSYQTYTRK